MEASLNPPISFQAVDIGHNVRRQGLEPHLASGGKQRPQPRTGEIGRLAVGRDELIEDDDHGDGDEADANCTKRAAGIARKPAR